MDPERNKFGSVAEVASLTLSRCRSKTRLWAAASVASHSEAVNAAKIRLFRNGNVIANLALSRLNDTNGSSHVKQQLQPQRHLYRVVKRT